MSKLILGKMATLDSLPFELLTVLLSHLPGRDLAKVACCCKRLRETASIESVWQERCRQEYGINKISSTRGITYYELYTQILYRYGRTLGVWQPDVGAYGGLVLVQFNGDRLEGIQCHSPTNPHITRPLRMRRIFTVELDENRQTMLLCHSRHGTPHPSELRQLKGEEDVFSCKCTQPEMHRHPEGKEAEFTEWLSLETDNDLHNFLYHSQELLLMKFLITSQFETTSSFTRLHLSAPNPSVFEIIPPGIFKGSYGCHGIELLSLSYDHGHKNITVTKISGDPNVPAGQVSIIADLSRPMVLSELQQGSIKTLTEIDLPDMPQDTPLDRLPTQPFRVPSDCHERDSNPPTRCKARFYSQGQVAGQGFTNPSFISGHLVIFNDNMFGHFWLDLRSFSLFSRITEDISKTIKLDAPTAYMDNAGHSQE